MTGYGLVCSTHSVFNCYTKKRVSRVCNIMIHPRCNPIHERWAAHICTLCLLAAWCQHDVVSGCARTYLVDVFLHVILPFFDNQQLANIFCWIETSNQRYIYFCSMLRPANFENIWPLMFGHFSYQNPKKSWTIWTARGFGQITVPCMTTASPQIIISNLIFQTEMFVRNSLSFRCCQRLWMNSSS